MVLPDLDDTTTKTPPWSRRSRTRPTAAGSVVSSTLTGIPPACGPRAFWSTSGKRLDPPIPESTTSVKPSATAASAKAVSSASAAIISSMTCIHPRRSATSVGSSCQTVWSPTHMRGTTSDAVSPRMVSVVASATGPSDRSKEMVGVDMAQAPAAAISVAASVATATVWAMSAGECASDGNMISYGPGAMAMPRSSIARKKAR